MIKGISYSLQPIAFLRYKLITDAFNCLDAIIADFLADFSDVNVNCSIAYYCFIAPNGIHDLFAGEDVPRP